MPISNPTIGATSTLALEANSKGIRNLVVLCNNSNEDIYVCPGAAAVQTAGIPLVAYGGSWTDKPDTRGKIYQGIWTAICISGGKVLSVTELNDGPR